MSTTTLSTVCRYSCSSPNWLPRRALAWPSSALMLSIAMTSAPAMRGARRWRAIVVLPTLPEKLMTATFMGDPCSKEGVGDVALHPGIGDGVAGRRKGARRREDRRMNCCCLQPRGGCCRCIPKRDVRSLAQASHFSLDGAQAQREACVTKRLPDGFARVPFRAKACDLRFEGERLALGSTRGSLGLELHVRNRFR